MLKHLHPKRKKRTKQALVNYQVATIMFGFGDMVPLNDVLLAMLVARGWDPTQLCVLQELGAVYSHGRKSVFLLGSFD